MIAHPPPVVVSRDVEIAAGGVALRGELCVPAGAPGIVVFVHGSGSGRLSPRNQFVARVIRDSGNGTLLFDLLTRSEERSEEASGHLRFDIELLAGRLVEATRWLLHQEEAAGLGVGYFGSSTGAAAALMAAARWRWRVDAVVSRGGRPDLAWAALPLVQAPTLLLVGGEDREVLALNEKALRNMHCLRSLRVVNGATHLFEEPGALETVADLAAQWFQETLHPHRGSADEPEPS